jgi:hypothetical protein
LVRLFPGTATAFIVANLNEFGIIGTVSGTIETRQVGNINLINTVNYSKLTGIPDEFTPEAHTHPYSDIEDTPSSLSEQFETVSKNLKSYPYNLTYGVDGIDTIVYDLGGGLSITKTFNYTLGVLTSIVLSGDTPSGIELTKTLIYTGVDLTNVSYS